MALNPAPAATATADHVALDARRPGLDVTRAVALIGVVVMNYHGYLWFADASPSSWWLSDLVHPLTGPLTTRFAATFVLVAGVGVTLMTRRAAGDQLATLQMRSRLVRRGLVLIVVGLPFDEIWPGTILPYYGVMFVLAAMMFTWRTRWLVATGIGAVGAAWAIHWWTRERVADGHDMRWLTSPDGLAGRFVFDLWVSGTHPLLPWLAVFCAGMIVGRMMPRPGWRRPVLQFGVVLALIGYGVSALVDHDRAAELASTDPSSRSLMYVCAILGVALIALVTIGWLADRWPHSPVVDVLQRVGQMTLTLYLVHALVFELVVRQLGWITPSGVDTSLTFALGYWAVGVALAVAWSRRFGRGPFERVYRALTD